MVEEEAIDTEPSTIVVKDYEIALPPLPPAFYQRMTIVLNIFLWLSLFIYIYFLNLKVSSCNFYFTHTLPTN